MGGVAFIEHAGRRILSIDLAHCELEDVARVIRESKKLIVKEAQGSVLTLTDVTGAHLNPMSTKMLKEFTAFNKPYVRAGAVVGVSGLLKVEFAIVMKFSGRNLARFPTPAEAKEWLVTQ